jgi:hypothetical protein
MTDAHLCPYTKDFSAETDAEISRLALAWIAGLHGISPGSITLENPHAEDTDVINATTRESIGQIQFVQEEIKTRFVIISAKNANGYRTVKVFPSNEIHEEYIEKYMTDETLKEIKANYPDAEIHIE